jgi:hypothetical protein
MSVGTNFVGMVKTDQVTKPAGVYKGILLVIGHMVYIMKVYLYGTWDIGTLGQLHSICE